MKDTNIHIIGAGISGLVCAIELERAGIPATLIERCDAVGGRVRTDEVDGYPLDRGFQVLLTAYPAAQRYLDYDTLDLRSFMPGSAVIKNGNISQFGDFLRDGRLLWPTLRSGTGSLLDKWKVFRLNNQLKQRSAADLFTGSCSSTLNYLEQRGFSSDMIEEFFRPFFGGIFLERDLDTPSHMFRFIFKMFAEGTAAIPAGGMQRIAGQLRAQLRHTEVRLNAEVVDIADGKISLANGTSISSDIIVIAGDYEPGQTGTDPLVWKGCSTHYFYTPGNILNAPLIALLADPAAVVNSFHYVTDLVGLRGSKHLLSATVVHEVGAVGHAQVADDLMKRAGLVDLEHIRSYTIPRSLPRMDRVQYAPSVESVRLRNGLYRAGDQLANGSLNAAMESGRVAAQAILADLGVSSRG